MTPKPITLRDVTLRHGATVAVRDLSGTFVPDHRAFSWLNLSFDGVPALDRLPQPAVFTLAGTLPLLGAAERVLTARLPQPIDPLDEVFADDSMLREIAQAHWATLRGHR